MKKSEITGDKRMTVREVSQATGIGYSTVAKYASKAGWTENGKKTYLTEAQVTILLEAVKAGKTGAAFHIREDGTTLSNVIEGLETELSLDLQIAMAEKAAREAIERSRDLWKQKAVKLKAENARIQQERNAAVLERDYERQEHNGTKKVLAFQIAGNKHHQNMLEALGAMRTDREDMLDTYRRNREDTQIRKKG